MCVVDLADLVVELVLVPSPEVRDEVEEAVLLVGSEVIHYVEHEVVVCAEEVILITYLGASKALIGEGFATDDLQTIGIVG